MGECERFGFTSSQRHRNAAGGGACIGAPATRRKENRIMEMHSRQSLSEVHDISVLSRRQSRRRLIAETAIARVLAFLKRMKTAIEAELAPPHAITELPSIRDFIPPHLAIQPTAIENTRRR